MKYQELVELSRSDYPKIKEQTDAWLVSIGLQGAAELKDSAFLLDSAIRNVKGEITRDEESQRLRERYGDTLYDEPSTGLGGGYEITSRFSEDRRDRGIQPITPSSFVR